jgi:hypothetical protein
MLENYAEDALLVNRRHDPWRYRMPLIAKHAICKTDSIV